MATVDVEAYWNQRKKAMGILSKEDDVRHTEFARFVHDHCGDRLLYVPGVGWHRWNGKVWEATTDDSPAYQVVTEASKILYRRAAENSGDMAWASRCASKMQVAHERKKIVDEMQRLRQFRVATDELDAQTHLLSFQNGTVDLRTGKLHPHNPRDRMTQIANVDYNPEAECPRWERFVEEIFPNEPELQEFYRIFLGMCITGETRDHALGVWYGAHGRNGKGATIRTMQSVFGSELVLDVPFEMYERVRGQQPHTELIASLRKARMVTAQEGNQGAPMDTARLKNHSGGDRISARHLHGKQFTFQPRFTLVLATNHLPEFAAGGAALWARTHAVLFGQSFADRVDMDLEPTIQGPEAEGVAAWVVEGARRYYEDGRLRPPLAVIAATEMHKEEVDPLKDLVGEIFVYEEGVFTPSREFNVALKTWRTDNGDTTSKYAPGAVKRHLLNSGKVEERRVSNRMGFVGIRLESPPTSPQVAPGQMGAQQ